MIVQAMEAFSIPIAAERSVKAKNKVLPYKAKSKTAPNNARKRFIFFISRNPFFMQQEEAFILYMETVKKSNTGSLKKMENGI